MDGSNCKKIKILFNKKNDTQKKTKKIFAPFKI